MYIWSRSSCSAVFAFTFRVCGQLKHGHTNHSNHSLEVVVHGGVGYHVDRVDPAAIQFDFKVFATYCRPHIVLTYLFEMIIPAQCLYVLVLAMAKLSALSLYLRLFGILTWVRIHIWVLTAVICGWAITLSLAALLICQPFSYNWDLSITGGVCGNRNAVFVAGGVVNMVTDILVIIIPLPSIWSLQLDIRAKIALSVIFCLGLLCVIRL
jgi:hypothetical protein